MRRMWRELSGLRGLFAALCLGLVAGSAVGQTSSPFQPPEQRFGRYVINSGPGLDTGCTFRSQGPLIIRFRVFATMNPAEVNADGTLKNPQKLIDNKVVSRYVTLSMPVFDIDSDQGEVDYVSLNGRRVLTLTGRNNEWTDAWGANNAAQIEISQLRFSDSLTSGPVNEIRIDIDQASPPGQDNWCMSVDWVAVEFKAAFPFVLAHGIAAGSDTWNEDDAPGVLQELTDTGLRFMATQTTNSSGRVAANAIDLRQQIAQYLQPMLAKKVHIIAHSKGGLDSQYLAYINPTQFEVLSLGTLSTPHLGSSVADVQVIQLVQANTYVQTGRDPNGYAAEFVNRSLAAFTTNVIGAGPQPPGLYDLTTQAAEAARRLGARGNVPNTFTVAADAGPQCTREPTGDELDEMIPFGADWGSFGYVRGTLQNAYMVMCNVASAAEVSRSTRTVVVCSRGGCFPVQLVTLTYDVAAVSELRPNDAVVTVQSAHGYGTQVATNTSTNHSEVKKRSNVRALVRKVIELE